MDQWIIAILICGGFIGFVLAMMKIILSAKKKQRQQQKDLDSDEPWEE